MYPINVGRNIARDAALTHFILASDIELYPSPNFVSKFLEMIARNEEAMQRPALKVYPIVLFEVTKESTVPMNKTALQKMLKLNTAIPFHQNICVDCHRIPYQDKWLNEEESEGMCANIINVI